MDTSKKSHLLSLLLLVSIFSACAEKDGVHTTVITHVPPPPHQVLTIVSKPVSTPRSPTAPLSEADMSKPLLMFDLGDGAVFRVGQEVPISIRVLNAKLRSDGGDFRIRYIVDDDEMQWRDTSEPFWLAGWLSGKHTIRVELIGPDGWPYRNGNEIGR